MKSRLAAGIIGLVYFGLNMLCKFEIGLEDQKYGMKYKMYTIRRN